MRILASTLFIILILLATSTYAADITVPNQLPAGVAWSFSVNLDPSNTFSETRVSIDGKEIATAFSNGQTSIDPFNGEQALKVFVTDTDPNSNAGMVFFVSHIGLQAGQHEIKAVVYSGGTVQNEARQSVNVIDVVSAGAEQTLNNRISEVESEVSRVEQQTNQKITTEVNDKVQVIQEQVDQQSQQNAETVSDLTRSVNDSIAGIQVKLDIVDRIDTYVAGLQEQERIDEQKRLEAEQQQAEGIGLSTGLLSLDFTAGLLDGPWVGLIGIIGAIAILLFFVRNRQSLSDKISLPDFDSTFGTNKSENDKAALDAVLKTKGKWAFGSTSDAEENDEEEDGI